MSPLASFVCDACRHRVKGKPQRTPTGRRVCENCAVSLTAVGVASATGQSLGETIATVGWLQRIRAARGKRGWPGEDQ